MIADCAISFARPCDAQGIALLSKDAIECGLGWSWTPERVLLSVRNVATNTIVARERDVLAGFAIMKYRDDQAHLLLMAVRADRRRRGIGSALLDWLEVTVATAGIAVVRLEARESNVPARAFYAAHGYRPIQSLRGYYEGREDAVVLQKLLSAAAL